MTQEAMNQVDNENNESTFLSEDAIVVGGEGDDARQCVSAASYNIKLEFLPEVRELAEIITSSVEKDTESENKKTKKTADSGKRKSSITVSKRSDTKNPPKKRKPIKKIIASAAAVLFLAVAVFAVYSRSHQLLLIGPYELAQRPPMVLTAFNNALVTFQPRDFPALAHIAAFQAHAFECRQLVASPQHGLQVQGKLEKLRSQYVVFSAGHASKIGVSRLQMYTYFLE